MSNEENTSLELLAADERSLPWNDPTRVYKAVHTRGGRILQICFIRNTGIRDRYRPLADLRGQDAAKDGSDLVLEFSDLTVVITGKQLRRTGDDIAIGRVAALEAFDPNRRDRPDAASTAPFIDAIRFYKRRGEEPNGDGEEAKH